MASGVFFEQNDTFDLSFREILIKITVCLYVRVIVLKETNPRSIECTSVPKEALVKVPHLLMCLLAAPQGMSSVYFNKGENCIAAGRLFVEESVHDDFISRVVRA